MAYIKCFVLQHSQYSQVTVWFLIFRLDRYVTGLEKLREAKQLITELQEELKLLQPRLVETSANTEALMIKIEQDTIQVERKKEVCIRSTFLSVRMV